MEPYNGRKLHVKVKKLPNFAGELRYGSEAASGLDLPASLLEDMLIIHPGEVLAVPSGIAIEIPTGYEGQVRCRSGLARNNKIGMINGLGTIDADYRGEIIILLINFGKEPFTILRGDRIAQLVFNEILRADIQFVPNLGFSERNEKGFGSSGF